ncbi:hypothetical protein EG878_16820, partial [Enterococcus faecalis]
MSGGFQQGGDGVLDDGLEGMAGEVESLAVVIGIAGIGRFGRGGLEAGGSQGRGGFGGSDEPVVDEGDADVLRVR